MGVRFACHACGAGLNIKSNLAGKRGKCPDCGAKFRIPLDDQPFSIPLEEGLTDNGQVDDAFDGDPNDLQTLNQPTEVSLSPAPLYSTNEPDNSSPFAADRDATRQLEKPLTADPTSNRSARLAVSRSAGPKVAIPAATVTAATVAAASSRLDAASTAKTTGQEEIEDSFDPLDDQNAQWYVRPPNGGRYGPADGATVRQWIQEGRVTRTTLLWRDGWAQWRDCDDIIPNAFAGSQVSTGVKPPPSIPPEMTSPVADQMTAQKMVSGTAARSRSARGTEYQPAEDYLGAKKRRRTRQRNVLIAVLATVAVVLVVALVVALAWPR